LILVFQMSAGSPVDGTGAFLVASSVTFILYLLSTRLVVSRSGVKPSTNG
jgi:hypothetical protein